MIIVMIISIKSYCAKVCKICLRFTMCLKILGFELKLYISFIYLFFYAKRPHLTLVPTINAHPNLMESEFYHLLLSIQFKGSTDTRTHPSPMRGTRSTPEGGFGDRKRRQVWAAGSRQLRLGLCPLETSASINHLM